MKRILCLFFAMLLLCGCSGKQNPPAEDPPEAVFTPEYQILPKDEPTDPEERLQWRRDVVEQQMRHMMSVLWRPAVTFTYSAVPASAGAAADNLAFPDQVITLYSDRIYQGIPYTHGSNGSVSFLSYATNQDENGVYTLTGLHEDLLTGISRSAVHQSARIGNDCADAVSWAWAMVSSTISFNDTVNMTALNGVIKVGDYECDLPTYSYDTRKICNTNGKQRMFEAYAQLQKADGMVHTTDHGSGHAIMVVSIHVERDANGDINGDKSCITLLQQDLTAEQTELSYYNEALGQEVYLCEELDVKRSFNSLFATGYLPITCKELVDPSDLPEPAVEDISLTPSRNNMFTGIIHATYRISYVTITIRNEKGKIVQQSTCFAVEQPDKYSFDLSRFLLPTEQAVLKGKLALDELKPGSYTCSYTCRLAPGDEIEFREFDFTV